MHSFQNFKQKDARIRDGKFSSTEQSEKSIENWDDVQKNKNIWITCGF